MKPLVLIALSILAMLLPTAACGQEPSYAYDSRFPFIIVSTDTLTTPPDLDDESFYSHSSGVIFRVNRTEIPLDDRFMTLYRDSVLPWINARHLQLRKVFVRGAASPEGPYANNRRLGEGRTKALLDELRRDLRFQYLKTSVGTSSITEDYGYLCRLMREAGDPDYDIVRGIYDTCGGDELCCKQKLMAYNGQRLWQRLLRQYFPRLRAARVILWFSLPDSQHAPVVLPDQDQIPFPVTEPGRPVVIGPIAPMMPALDQAEPVQPRYRRHVVALRTNLAHDFFYMPRYGWAPTPNLQLEYYPWNGHYTFNLGLSWMTRRDWGSHRFYQVRDLQFEVRRYFKGKGRFLGLYVGAAAEGTVYGIGLNNKEGWEGEGGAVSLTAGYVMPLTRNKRLRLEFMIAAGYFLSRLDPYVYGNPFTGKENGKYYYDYLGRASDFKRRNHSFTWIGPTNVGIQLTYDILYRKRQKVQHRIATGRLLKENCF